MTHSDKTRTRLDIVEDFDKALRHANLGHSKLGAGGKIPGNDEWSNRSIDAVKGAMIVALKRIRTVARDNNSGDQGHVKKLQGLLDEFAGFPSEITK